MNYTENTESWYPWYLHGPAFFVTNTVLWPLLWISVYQNHNLTIEDMDVVNNKSGFMVSMPFNILIIFGLEWDIVQHYVLSFVIFLTGHDVTKWLKIKNKFWLRNEPFTHCILLSIFIQYTMACHLMQLTTLPGMLPGKKICLLQKKLM